MPKTLEKLKEVYSSKVLPKSPTAQGRSEVIKLLQFAPIGFGRSLGCSKLARVRRLDLLDHCWEDRDYRVSE